MEQWVGIFIAVVTSVIASSGFWAWLQNRNSNKDWKTKLLVGLAHDRIVYLGMQHVEKGEITQDEYENLHDYLYVPYEKLGGNGTAKKVMDEVSKLRITK